jgi:hypothetical protein
VVRLLTGAIGVRPTTDHAKSALSSDAAVAALTFYFRSASFVLRTSYTTLQYGDRPEGRTRSFYWAATHGEMTEGDGSGLDHPDPAANRARWTPTLSLLRNVHPSRRSPYAVVPMML